MMTEKEGNDKLPSVETIEEEYEKEDTLLWEEELRIRQEVSESRISGNFLGAFFVNTYSSIHIFVVYLICLESLLSIGLSVGMTVCEYYACMVGFFGKHLLPETRPFLRPTTVAHTRIHPLCGNKLAHLFLCAIVSSWDTNKGPTTGRKIILPMMDRSWTGSSYPLLSLRLCQPRLGWPFHEETKP